MDKKTTKKSDIFQPIEIEQWDVIVKDAKGVETRISMKIDVTFPDPKTWRKGKEKLRDFFEFAGMEVVGMQIETQLF